MWDIYPIQKRGKKPIKPKLHKPQRKTKKRRSIWQKLFTPIKAQEASQAPRKTAADHFFRKKTVSKTRSISFWMILLAFVVALIIVLGYLFRDKLKFIKIKNIRFQPLVLTQQPAQIEITPATKNAPLTYYLTQKQEKVSVKSFESKEEKIIYTFNTSEVIHEGTASLGKNYLAYIDSEGLKLYSFQDKQSDFILSSTNISRINQVGLSPDEQYLAFTVTKDAQSKIYVYSLKERRILEDSFDATGFSFGAKDNLYFGFANSLFVYNLIKKESDKITDFSNQILGVVKTNNLIFIITGNKTSITLWQVNEKEKSAANLSNFQLTFNFKLEDFGLAKKENTLYLSFAGEIIALDLNSKTKKEHTFGVEVYRLLNYLADKDYFIALKKSSALTETSLVIFKESDIIFESPIEEKIVFLK